VSDFVLGSYVLCSKPKTKSDSTHEDRFDGFCGERRHAQPNVAWPTGNLDVTEHEARVAQKNRGIAQGKR